MKKTLALALVAAMTISMASMTAFAKEITYTDTNSNVWPEKTVAEVKLNKDDMTKTQEITGYTAKEAIDHSGINIPKGDPVDVNTYKKLAEDKDKCEPVYGDAYTIKFGDLKLKTFDNTATKTWFGWFRKDDATDATSLTDWPTDNDPADKNNVMGDDDIIQISDANFTGGVATIKFQTVGRTDTTDEQIAKNLEKIENAKKDKEKAEANKKDLEKWDEEHNATNNVVKPDDDGKTVVDTAGARVTYMGGKWDNKDAQYYGNDDYCRHAAQVIGLGEGPGDMYDIYSVEAPAGFLKGKSARITLTPAVMKNPSDFDITVYHVEGWCKAKKVKDFKIVDNKIVLWGDSFSPYVVVYNTKGASSTGSDASNPSTGDFSAVPVALLAAAALGATGFVAYKKRKAE